MTMAVAPAARELESSRSEQRARVVQLVEYGPWPRRSKAVPRRLGFSHDRSGSGLGLDVPEPLTAGALLRVMIRDVDGATAMEGLARVVWCRRATDRESGRAPYRAGLSLLRDAAARPLLRAPAERPDLLD